MTTPTYIGLGFMVMVLLSTIFQLYQLSVISWGSVLLMEETVVPGENY